MVGRVDCAQRRTASPSGLLRIAADFGLLTGGAVKEFASYHLPDESFLYLLHAIAATEHNARRIIDADDWRMYLMDAADVERELLRLHQFHRLTTRSPAASRGSTFPPTRLPRTHEELVA